MKAQEEMIVNGRTPFDYTVRRSPRRRTMIVSIEKGNVIVRAPKRLSAHSIEEFLRKEQAWVMRKLGESRKRLDEAPVHHYADGEEFPYVGYSFALRLATGPRTEVTMTDDELIVMLGPGASRDRVPGILQRWYLAKAREVFAMRAAYYAGELGLEPPGISVRNQKQRWGSCSSKGRINLNWRLITAPVGVLDYVIAHEICHIVHQDHSRRFWALLGTLIPEYRDCRKWLRENGHKLGL
jgi:predicted metal-dependent hydrolase